MNEQNIRKIAMDQGIDCIGFFSCDSLIECLPYLEKRLEQGFNTGYEGGTPEERIDYCRYFSEAKSGIVIGVSNFQELKKPMDDKLRGALATVAWGDDYHQVLKEKMMSLMEAINQHQTLQRKQIVTYKCFVDDSPLVDRGSAYRAGLGFFGKNNFLINKNLGSFFFIGQILIDCRIEFARPKVIPNGCGDCHRCLDACPNNALGSGFSLNPSRCISYLTQKKELTEEEQKYLKIYLYGCDLCQKVCPYNQDLERTNEERFWIKPKIAYPELKLIINLSNESFCEQFGKTAASWRGKKVLIRNAELIKKNAKKNLK